MNKIYRVIWNASIGAWVAVSELATSKSKSRSKAVGSIVAVLGAVSFAPNAFAAASQGGMGTGTVISKCLSTTGNNLAANANGSNGVAIGCNAQSGADAGILDRENPYNNSTNKNDHAIKWSTDSGFDGGSTAIGSGAQSKGLATAIGTYAQAEKTAAVAIGVAAVAGGNTSLAVGRQSAALADYAQAIGNVAVATQKGTLAIGHSATATGYRAIAIGSPDIENAPSIGAGQKGNMYQTVGQTLSSGKDSIAFGGGANATADNALSIGAFSKALGEKSVAIGTGAEATEANAVVIGEKANSSVVGGVALGMNSQVNTENSAAIGMGSIATQAAGAGFLTNQAIDKITGVVSVGKDGEVRRIQNVGDGAADSDAVTVAQLKKQKELTDKQGGDTASHLGGNSSYNPTTGAISAPQYKINGDNYTNVGDALVATKTEVEEGKNIKVDWSKGDDGQSIYTVKTKDDVSFDSVHVGGNTEIDGNGLIVDGGPALTKTKVDVAGNKITSVAAGDLNAKSTDAVNGSQLHATNTNVTNLQNQTWKIQANGDEASAVKASDTVEFVDGKNIKIKRDKNQITVATDENVEFTTVKLGDTLINQDGLKIGDKGPSITVDGINAADQKITNVAAGEISDKSKDAVNGSQLNDVKNTAEKGWTVATDSAGKATQVKPGATVNFKGGDNIAVTNEGTDVTVALSQDIKVDSIGLNGQDGKDGTDGISITAKDGAPGLNGADGTTTKRIVYKKPDGTTEEVATLNDGLKFAGNTGDVLAKTLNETLSIEGELADDATASGANLRVDSKDGKLNLVMAKDLTDLTSVTVGDTVIKNAGLTIKDGPSITVAGIDAGNKVISNVAAGKISADSKDAVNGSQLNDVKNTAEKGWTVATDSGTDSQVKPGDKVSFNGDDNISVSNDGNNVKVELSKDINVDSLVLNGKNGENGISITGAAGSAALDGKDGMTRIIYEGPNGPEEVATLNDGLKFTGNDGKTIAKKLNEELEIVGGMTETDEKAASSKNIRTVNKDGKLEIQLSKNLTDLTSVTVGDTVINNAGLTIKDGPTFSKTKVDVAGNQIKNVAAGVEGTDAVNVDQLSKAQAAAKTEVKEGDNIVVTETVDEVTGASTYTVATARDVNFDSVKVGNVVINHFTNTIEGLSNLDLSANDFATQGRAATEEQLKKVMDSQAANNDGAVKYDKNADGSVNKDSVTFEGTTAIATPDANGNITTQGGTSLNNVASAGDYTDLNNASNGVNAADLNNAVNNAVNKAGDNVANILGGDTTVNADGSVTNNNIGGTGESTIHDAISSINNGVAAAKTEVTAGKNMTVVNKGPGANGQDIYEVATADDVKFNSVTSNEVHVGDVHITENGINAGGKQITNVADGAVNKDSKDAVNGSQLNTTNQNVVEYLGGGSKIENGVWTGPSYTVGHGDTANQYTDVGGAIDALNKQDQVLGDRITNLGDRMEQVFYDTNKHIDNVEKKANAGIAAAMALESAPFIAGKYTYAAGAAYHGGENAVGVTLRKTSDNGRWSITGGVAAASQGDPSVRIGISGVIN